MSSKAVRIEASTIFGALRGGLKSFGSIGMMAGRGGTPMRWRNLAVVAAAMGILASCSLKQAAINTVISALSEGSGTAFTGDTDPELVGDALPFALKLYETLLAQSPENEGLLLTTGSGFVMYANAYVQTPADMLPEDRYEEKVAMRERSRALYLRGRDYLIRGLDIRHPGFAEAVTDERLGAMLERTTVDDVAFLYWAGAGWMAAIGINSFDVKLGVTREAALSLLLRALELDESWSDGAIHEVLITYYGSMPEMLGGSEEKARGHFDRAVEISGGAKPGPYIALAQAVTVKKQDHEEFIRLLESAVAIDDEDPESALVTIISQNKAKWLLEHVDDFFLID
jgi:predicted anti-sigma-YlaC factor YlaD